ncbi:MAG: YkgJ family cysteine cluster protein [Candidatus Thorarchaeota archaeon]
MNNIRKPRFTCTRCGNCCTDRNTLVNVTYLDILRIIKGLKLNLKESLEIFGFYVYEKKLTPITLKKMVISPIETENGLAFIGLMKNSQGECLFHDKTNLKCRIYTLRPMFCRSFPFCFGHFNNEDTISKEQIEIFYTEKAKEYCPGIGDDAPLINLEYWINLAQKVLKELKENNIYNENWNNSIKNGPRIPSAKNFIEEIIKIEED